MERSSNWAVPLVGYVVKYPLIFIFSRRKKIENKKLKIKEYDAYTIR